MMTDRVWQRLVGIWLEEMDAWTAAWLLEHFVGLFSSGQNR